MQMRVTFPGGRRVDATFAGHVVSSDQPVEDGGAGTAPSPFDYFLASIAMCSGFYALRFLQQRGLAADDVRLTLDTQRDPDTHLVTLVTLRLTVPEDFPEKYRKALVRAMDLCSVKKHLGAPPRLETIVEVGGQVAA